MNKIDGYNNQVQFQARKLSIRRRNYIQQKASGMLHQNFNDIVELSKDVNDKRMNFFETLAELYNQRNFYRQGNEKENSNFVIDIFSKINKPKDIHYYIAHKFNSSFENMSRILDDTRDEKKRLNFVKTITDEIFNGDIPKDNTMLVELLESPYSEKYVKQYKDIKPYLLLNKNDKKAVQDLNTMFEQKSFNKKLYQNGLKNESIRNRFNWKGTDILNKDIFLNNYNQYTRDFMHTFKHSFYITDEAFELGADKNVLYMLETSNKKNTDFRRDIMRGFADNYQDLDTKSQLKKIETLKNIFEISDNDRHAKNFIKKVLSSRINSKISLKELEDIITNIPTKKLDIFKNNVMNIINQTNDGNRIEIIRENIKNPFYMSEYGKATKENLFNYGFKAPITYMQKIKLKVANYFNILRDSLTANKQFANTQTTTIKQNSPVVAESISPIAIEHTSIEKSLVEAEKPVETIEEKAKKHTSTRAEQKKEIKNNVLDLIKSRLGEKTLEKQKNIYEKNATKMRLGMLPEIFASVADTRKADRAVGKRRINSSNKDVLDLFVRINGANKKFVNYLLKKRNIDGTRMFEIKDIIATIDKAEAKIAKEKKLNPEYKTKDARKYYNHLYEAKIEQYGKVKPQRKFKTNA